MHFYWIYIYTHHIYVCINTHIYGELLDHVVWILIFIQKNLTVFKSDYTYSHYQDQNITILVTPHPANTKYSQFYKM